MQISTSLTQSPTRVQTPSLSIWRDLVIMTLIFLAALCIFALNWRYSFTNGAYGTLGGESTLGAERILHGEMPYRDFWTLYAPGHFYLLALLFRCFGTHLLVETVAASVFCALAITLCYWLVRSSTQRPSLGLAAAGIFFAALLNAEHYYLRFETYPPTILFLLISLTLLVAYYRTGQSRYLLLAGLLAGLLTLVKHDVGLYTAIATGVGLIVYHSISRPAPFAQWRLLVGQLVQYGICLLVIVLPVVVYFALAAGPDAWQDVIVFPLTDWRYSRPEFYPSLLPTAIFSGSRSEQIDKLFEYVKFTTPFVINLLGLVAIGMAMRRRKATYGAIATTFWVAFWFHYVGAHLQINTHIVTMAMYAAGIGAILYGLLTDEGSAKPHFLLRILALVLVCSWSFALAARPLYNAIRKQSQPMVVLHLPKVSGFQVMPFEAASLNALADFVNQHIPPDQYLYIGLNRHDTMVTNDILAYFVLDRAIPVRYHDLHPAVADRAAAQQEMIVDLEKTQPPYVVLKTIFPDEELDQIKADFQKNLPGVGATDLDQYLHKHYKPIADFAPYQVWVRE